MRTARAISGRGAASGAMLTIGGRRSKGVKLVRVQRHRARARRRDSQRRRGLGRGSAQQQKRRGSVCGSCASHSRRRSGVDSQSPGLQDQQRTGTRSSTPRLPQRCERRLGARMRTRGTLCVARCVRAAGCSYSSSVNVCFTNSLIRMIVERKTKSQRVWMGEKC